MRLLLGDWKYLVWIITVFCAITHRYEEFLGGVIGILLVGTLIECLVAALAFARSIRLYQGTLAGIIANSYQLDAVRQAGPSTRYVSPPLDAVITVQGIGAIALVVMWAWWRFIPLILLFWFQLAGIVYYYLHRLMPPVVLYLAGSSKQSYYLWRTLLRSFYPFKVASGLDIQSRDLLGKYLDAETDQEIARNSYRIIAARSWTAIIESLIQSAPTILIDTRTVSPALELEVNAILRADMLSKAVILTTDIPDATSLGSSLIERLPESERWRCVTESALIGLLNVERRSLGLKSMATVLHASVYGLPQRRSWAPTLTNESAALWSMFIVGVILDQMHGFDMVDSISYSMLVCAGAYLILSGLRALVRRLTKPDSGQS
jgi:hypothetical protein